MNILITGTAGFIGFSVAKELLDKNHQIYGIDNLDNYYSVKLKKKRLEELKKYKNFIFYDIDITNKKNIKKISKLKIKLLYHFAAQPGVRYSLVNPKKYYDTNVKGFENILDIINKKQLTKVIYASSSSVYGDQTKFPTKEDSPLNAKNPYGVSKMMNENLASIYSNIYNLNFVGLRLFTVYGEWGRPDMLILKYIIAIIKKKTFYLNNYGKHYRDFTYVKDVVDNIWLLINKNIKDKHLILNVCSNNPVSLMFILDRLNKVFGKPKIIKRSKQIADVYKTHGDNYKINQITKFKKYTNINVGLDNLINWVKSNKEHIN